MKNKKMAVYTKVKTKTMALEYVVLKFKNKNLAVNFQN
jgi:hypothetical protein